MFIELNSVFNSDNARIEIDYSFDLGDESVSSPVSVNGAVFNQVGIVRLCADAGFDYSTSCALCNKPILRHARVPVRHILVQHTESEDNDEFIVVDNMRLDLDELISEDIYLAIPSRFLCKEDCKGLCSICGSDLNEGPCDCKKPTDSVWDVLRDLLDE